MTTKRLLLVEDDEPVRRGIEEILRDAGWDVTTARDGEEAHRLFKAQPADVVLTDLLMPRLDGLGLLAELHAIDPDVPVVVITGFGTIERCRDALRNGAVDFLQKPCEADEILRTVDRAYRRRQEVLALESLATTQLHWLSFTVPSTLEKHNAVISKVASLASAAGWQSQRWGISLALDEAFTNAVMHGNGGDATKTVEVTADFNDQQATIQVRDQGVGFDAAGHRSIESKEGPGGRGLFLIRSFCDRAEWLERGTLCRMTFLTRSAGSELPA